MNPEQVTLVARQIADELVRLRDERDQALIRAEAAEAELDAYRRTERTDA